MKKVFPEIGAICRDRGVTFTEVDLRWGLTNEESTLGRTIRICLEEVDRCRPYFIGILGSSYGWVPSVHDARMDPELISRYPWVDQAVNDGVSITEMEFTEGVFSCSPNARARAFFYRRMESTAEPDDRLRSLVDRLRMNGYDIHDFATPADLGEAVRADLLALIDTEWPESVRPSEQQREDRIHAAFALGRRRAYTPSAVYMDRMNDWLEGDDAPLAIAGPSGSGKSSLAAYGASVFSRRRPTAFIVEHYVGASDGSATLGGMLRHIIGAIRERYGLQEELPQDDDVIALSLPYWLAQMQALAAARSDVPVIIIDAVNQGEDTMRSLTWLPTLIPPGIKLVITTTPGDILRELRTRGFSVLEIGPLDDVRVRESIVARYLGDYHKRIDPDLLRRIAGSANGSSPLFLRVVAEELRLHGHHESVASMVDRYASVADLDDLFQCMLERLEEDFGRQTVDSVFSLVYVSRSGLSEPELLDLTGASRMELSRLLFALEFHLIRRDALLDFFHDYLRRAAKSRYLRGAETETARRMQLARYFARHPHDARRAHEEPWQLFVADDYERLRHCVCDPTVFLQLNQATARHELMRYWRFLQGRYDPVEEYRRMIANHRRHGLPVADRVSLVHSTGEFLSEMGFYPAAENALELIYRYRRLRNGPGDRATLKSLDGLATVLYHQGRFHRAETLWQSALSGLERIDGHDSPSLCPVLDSLAATAFRRGDVSEVERLCVRSTSIGDRHFGPEHPASIDRQINRAEMELAAGRFNEGVAVFQKVLEVSRRAYGDRHPITFRCRVELGFALNAASRTDESLDFMEPLVEQIHALMGDTLLLSRALEVLGESWLRIDAPGRAESVFRRESRIRVALQGEAHPDVWHSQCSLAIALRRQGRIEDAERIVRSVLPRQIDTLGAADASTLRTMQGLITILLLTGRGDEAAKWQLAYDLRSVA